MNLSDLLDRPIAFQRSFVRLTKSINAALFLSQAMYWSKRTDPDNGIWFFKKQSDWEDETGLTRREQETARKTLREMGILEEKLIGLPATLWFSVNLENLRTTLAATASSDVRKQPSKIGGKRHTIDTETTTETTTDIGEEAKASKAKQFQKPLVEEVAEYADEIDLDGSEVRAFMDHHEARGWMLGSAKMKDWRAALRTWQRNAKKFAPRIAQRTGPEPITNDGIWQGYLDSLCREWDAAKPDWKYAENALRRARGHVGCDVIAEYLKSSYGAVVSEWQTILKEIE